MISYDPGESQAGGDSSWAGERSGSADSWLELLVDGLTFDFVGLAPGPGISAPEVRFRIDCDKQLDLDDYDLVGLAPGPHLSGGARSLVVAKVLSGLGCDIARELGTVKGFYWLPSLSVTGPQLFTSSITAWVEGGPFPALGLTAFQVDGEGGLESVGLSFFTGQELVLSAELAGDPASATRLAMRLVHQLALHGTLDEDETVTGPDGARIILKPDEGGTKVKVMPG